MRRKDREITDYNKMLEILDKCDCCRIGFKCEEGVYIVPLNFGYVQEDEGLELYFHGAKEGRKIELIKNKPLAGFELDTKHELVGGETACDYTYMYQSITGNGKIELVDDYNDKVRGLRAIMSHYSDKSEWEFDEHRVNGVAVIKMTVTEWSCKVH